MVIIGDAAHAVIPASGQGCSLAIEDAVVLAQCLRDATAVPAALARYKQLRRPRIDRVVGWTSGSSPRSSADRSAGRCATSRYRSCCGGRPRGTSASMAWLFTHHVDWTRPASAPPVPWSIPAGRPRRTGSSRGRASLRERRRYARGVVTREASLRERRRYARGVVTREASLRERRCQPMGAVNRSGRRTAAGPWSVRSSGRPGRPKCQPWP